MCHICSTAILRFTHLEAPSSQTCEVRYPCRAEAARSVSERLSPSSSLSPSPSLRVPHPSENDPDPSTPLGRVTHGRVCAFSPVRSRAKRGLNNEDLNLKAEAIIWL